MMVMRRFLFLLVTISIIIAFTTCPAEAQFWTDRAKNPKATFSQTEFDLGKVTANKEMRFRIAFKNTGDAYLQIQDISIKPKPENHKLDFIWPKGAVLPEDSGAIEMIFSAAALSDSFRFIGTIVFNNKYSKNIIVKGKGAAIQQEIGRRGPLLFFEKNFCDLEWMHQGQRNNCSFKLMNIGDEPLLITAVKSNSDSIKIQFSKHPVLPGKEAEITAEFEAVGYGPFRRYLNVETNIKGAEPYLLIIKGKFPAKK